MHAVLSWISTIIFLPVFGLVMVTFDVAQRVARLFGTRPQEYVAGFVQWLLVKTFGICGTRVAVERSPEQKPWTSYIIVSNHQSMFDIVILGGLLQSNFPKYISKRSLGKWIPTVSYNLRVGGHVLIDRGDAPGALEAIRDLGRRIRDGDISAMIFPEGTRARHGELGRFKPAGTLALLEEAPDTPVLPVTIDESWRLLEHNYLPVPWGTRVRVHIGAPIARRADEDHLALIDRVHDEIAATLERWRRPPS
ncbi:MAG TPA: lysophospholipid acyltransferase family protein [Candidatus Binatia bacterium]|jgi:1-acyl-sn-glycerol-3-phosphate acyltransferase|nr:lysophospholipid acyltransferase family protein [Candidatus Binatia bacterium]